MQTKGVPIEWRRLQSKSRFVTTRNLLSILMKLRSTPDLARRKLSIFTARRNIASIALDLRRAFLFSADCRLNWRRRVVLLLEKKFPSAQSRSAERRPEFIRYSRQAAGIGSVARRCPCSIPKKSVPRFSARELLSVLEPSR